MSTSTKRKTEEAPAAAKKAKAETSTSTKAANSLPDGNAASDKPSSGLLEQGSRLPSITLKDESGQTVSINELKKAVLFTWVRVITPFSYLASPFN